MVKIGMKTATGNTLLKKVTLQNCKSYLSLFYFYLLFILLLMLSNSDSHFVFIIFTINKELFFWLLQATLKFARYCVTL